MNRPDSQPTPGNRGTNARPPAPWRPGERPGAARTSPPVHLGTLTVPLTVITFVLCGVILTFTTGPVVGWAVLTGGMLMAMLISNPKVLLLSYFAWVTVEPAIESIFFNRAIQTGDEIFVGVIALVAAGIMVINRYHPASLTTWTRMCAAFAALGALSVYLNGARPMPAVHFFISYAGFIPCFYLARFSLQKTEKRNFFVLAVAILLLQLVFNVSWLYGINPIPNRSSGSVDFAIGTVGGNPLVAYLSIAVFLLSFALFLNTRSRPLRLGCVALMGLSLIELYLTYANHAYMLFVAALVFQLVFIVKRVRYVVVLAAIAFVFLSASRIVQTTSPSLVGSTELRETLDKDYLKERWHAMLRGSKGSTYRRILIDSVRDLPYPLLGAGPGNFASSIGAKYASPLAVRYIYEYYMSFSGRSEMIGGSITQQVIVGALGIYSETGPIGFALFFGLHLYALFRIWRQLREGYYPDVWSKSLAQVFPCMMVIYLFINLLSDFLQFDFLQLSLWLWAALLWEGTPPVKAAKPADATEGGLPMARLGGDLAAR